MSRLVHLRECGMSKMTPIKNTKASSQCTQSQFKGFYLYNASRSFDADSKDVASIGLALMNSLSLIASLYKQEPFSYYETPQIWRATL
jgi:hypothetical protein